MKEPPGADPDDDDADWETIPGWAYWLVILGIVLIAYILV